MKETPKPINRIGKYFSEEEYQFQLEMGREYMEATTPSYITLYQVDLQKSQVDDIYGEAEPEEVSFKNPVDIPAIVKLAKPESKTYNQNGTLYYEEFGNLTASILLDHLKELNVEINFGDYISYRVTEQKVIYFQVSKPANKHFENENTFGGYKAFYKTIFAVPVEMNEQFLG